LREFEDRRNNSVDWREKRSSSQPPENSTPINNGSKGALVNYLTLIYITSFVQAYLTKFSLSDQSCGSESTLVTYDISLVVFWPLRFLPTNLDLLTMVSSLLVPLKQSVGSS
jgi:hypothetical protein